MTVCGGPTSWPYVQVDGGGAASERHAVICDLRGQVAYIEGPLNDVTANGDPVRVFPRGGWQVTRFIIQGQVPPHECSPGVSA